VSSVAFGAEDNEDYEVIYPDFKASRYGPKRCSFALKVAVFDKVSLLESRATSDRHPVFAS